MKNSMLDPENFAEMKQLLTDAANLMPPVHTPEMKAWWDKARWYVLPRGHDDCTVCTNRVAGIFNLNKQD